nr:histone-like nucleoid-structuring protein Lsr2 [Rhodococcus sp. ACS1]
MCVRRLPAKKENKMAQSPNGSKGSAKTTREIREWAIGAGLDVSPRGRIPAEIVEAFEDAQAKKVQATTASAKKVQAKKVQAKKVQAKNSATMKAAVTKAAVNKVAAKKAPAAKTTRDIREWAIGAGLDVSARGRIPAEIVEAFEDAQAKKVQAKKVQAKKVQAKKVQAKKVQAKNSATVKAAVTKAAVNKVAAKKAPAAKTTRDIREWAIGAGLDVSARGRIPAEIVEAFEGAQAKKGQPKKVQATRGPAKKVAAGKPAAEKIAAQKSVVKTSAVKKVDTEKPVVRKAPAAKTTSDIREWAIGAGLDVSSRGRISAEVERAFHDAQVQKVQAETVRAKKVVAGKPAVKKVAAKKVAAKKTAAKKTAARTAPLNSAAASKAPVKRTTRDIREWAIGEGLDISARGRISAEIVDAFHLAQAKAPAA